MITEPGVYDLDEVDYHADPVPGGSLSSTGARRILPPGCPALLRWERQHPVTRAEYDLGHAAHRLVLGVGADLARIDAEDWRTKAAKAARDDARAGGRVPLLAHQHDEVHAMARALREHPVASVLLDAHHGRAEQSLIWRDPDTGVWCRGRVDWLRDQHVDRAILVDYKTTTNAAVAAIARSVAQYGYHQQADWYLDGARRVGAVDEDAAYLLVVQERTAPYLVSVVEMDAYALAVGAERNARAREIYARCDAAGDWPGYATDITLIGLPAWADRLEDA